MSNGQPISKVLQALLKNITKINGCEKQMIEILFATSDNQALFENILSVFMAALREPRQLEQLCVKYVEITESLTDRQLNRFEQLLLETPGAAPIATRLCARKIASSKNPEDEFWRFYDNQRSRISANSGFTIEPMILACINNVDAKIREDVAIDILRKINASVINDGETIMVLTNAVNDCSVIVRYLRSLDEDRLLDVRQAVIQDVPSSRCDYLFDEVRRKEGFVEKLGGFFHKK